MKNKKEYKAVTADLPVLFEDEKGEIPTQETIDAIEEAINHPERLQELKSWDELL